MSSDELLPQLNIRAEPLIHGARLNGDGLFHPPSKDYLSKLMSGFLVESRAANMDTRNVRGMSISKIVQVAPSLKKEALHLGRWTNEKTFKGNYAKPVNLVSKKELPARCLQSKNLQQCIRHGLVLRPPTNVSVADFVRHHSHWLNTSFAGVGKVTSFEDGMYMVRRNNTTKGHTHFDLFTAVAESKIGGPRVSVRHGHPECSLGDL